MLLCLGAEVFGRWSAQCIKFAPALARERSRGLNPRIRRGVALSLQHRWWCILGIALQKNCCELRSQFQCGCGSRQYLVGACSGHCRADGSLMSCSVYSHTPLTASHTCWRKRQRQARGDVEQKADSCIWLVAKKEKVWSMRSFWKPQPLPTSIYVIFFSFVRFYCMRWPCRSVFRFSIHSFYNLFFLSWAVKAFWQW